MYPKVLSEEDTLARVLAGESIARFGDGELKLMMGRRCVSQIVVPGISDELKQIALAKGKALVGIPTLDTRSPKHWLWERLKVNFGNYLRDKGTYGSAFITRPDSAPWIGTPEFFDKIESLWKGQRITFVGNGERSLTPQFLLDTGAAQVDWVKCSYAHSYVNIDDLTHDARGKGNHRILLCVGPTATCMAERLAQFGHHAVDLGHIGMFWRRYDQFETWQEQREININTGKVEPNP